MKITFNSKSCPFLIGVFVLFMATTTYNQTSTVKLAKPNKEGWIQLYDGTNDSNFYTQYKNKNKGTFPDNVFTKGGGDTISVTGKPTGHVIFKQSFSHYKAKFQFHYPNNKYGNSGLLLHIQPDDPTLGTLFPRSLESQGDPSQGMGELWCISNVWVTIRVRPGIGPGGNYFGNVAVYDPTMPEVTYGNINPKGRRAIAGIEGWATPVLTPEMNDQWVEMEVDVHGSDSIAHKINGKTVIKYRNPRVAITKDSSKVDALVEKVLDKGLLGWQSEGVPVLYRNIMIKLYPEDPLYAELYPTSVSKKPSLLNSTVIKAIKGGITVTGSKGKAYQIQIRSLNGKLIKEFSGSSDKSFQILNNQITSGLFFVQISSKVSFENYKFFFN